jgi:hypothetical protein
MRTLRKVISACGAAIIVVALAVAFVATEGPTRVSASAPASASNARALEITPRDRTQDAVGLPAVWVPHDVMVAYRNLPRAYSCDALWYKVRDILREAGAWRSVSITPYDCKPSTASDGRSPQLEIRFLTPRTLGPAQARLARELPSRSAPEIAHCSRRHSRMCSLSCRASTLWNGISTARGRERPRRTAWACRPCSRSVRTELPMQERGERRGRT